MNKLFLYFPILLAGLNTACSTHHHGAEKPVSQQAEAIKTSHAKPKKMRHKTLPEGVISVDIVTNNNRLHLLTGKHQQGHKTLWYQYSNDEGKNWSSANKILNTDNLPAKIVRGNDAQIAAQGNNIVVSWMKYVEGARFNAGPMLTVRSIDAGQTWQHAATPPDWENGPHGYIDMAADKYAMHAVWLDSRDGRSSINATQGLRYAQSVDGGLSWQTNKTLDKITCSCCWNTVKSDTDGNAFVLYRDKQPSDLSIGVITQQQQWQRLNHVGAFNWQFDGCPHIGGNFDFQKTTKIRKYCMLWSVLDTQSTLAFIIYIQTTLEKPGLSTKRLGDETAIHADIATHNNGRVVSVWDMMAEDGLGSLFFRVSRSRV